MIKNAVNINGDDEMIAEYVENCIKEIINKTKAGALNWKSVDKIDEWESIKKQIVKTKEVDLKDYFIDDTKSYCVYKSGGYVMVLNIRYGNAPVFSPVLDKYILVIKINADLMPQNLSNYALMVLFSQDIPRLSKCRSGDYCFIFNVFLLFFEHRIRRKNVKRKCLQIVGIARAGAFSIKK